MSTSYFHLSLHWPLPGSIFVDWAGRKPIDLKETVNIILVDVNRLEKLVLVFCTLPPPTQYRLHSFSLRAFSKWYCLSLAWNPNVVDTSSC